MKKLLLLAALFLSSCTERIHTTVHGTPGSSCTVQQLANGALLNCSDGSSAIVYNGVDGAAAPTTLGVVGFIKPCGDEFNNDEVFVRMSDGSILALYDGGPHLDRLVLLAPGNYVTTDRNGNNNCSINVDSNLNVVTSPTAATGPTQGLQ